jgi:hypothetical protein
VNSRGFLFKLLLTIRSRDFKDEPEKLHMENYSISIIRLDVAITVKTRKAHLNSFGSLPNFPRQVFFRNA